MRRDAQRRASSVMKPRMGDLMVLKNFCLVYVLIVVSSFVFAVPEGLSDEDRLQNGSKSSADAFTNNTQESGERQYNCDLSAVPFFLGNHKHLNVSWKDAVEGDTLSVGHDGFEKPIEEIPGYLIAPSTYEEGVPALEIEFNKTYHIKLAKSNCSIEYTVPDCIGDVCHCKKNPIEIKMNSQYISAQQHKITWEINEPNIPKKIQFYYQTHNHSDELAVIISNTSYTSRFGSALLNVSNFEVNHGHIYVTIMGRFEFNDAHNKCVENVKTTAVLTESRLSEMTWVTACVFIFVLVLIVLVITFCMRNFRPKQRKPITINMVENESYLPQDIISLEPKEIKYSTITLLEIIGEGYYGIVYRGKIRKFHNHQEMMDVAVKTCKGRTNEDSEDFLSEINIMRKVGFHENIVRLYGFCIETKPNAIVMEYIPNGSLLKYLQSLRPGWERLKDNDSVFHSYRSGYFTDHNGTIRKYSEEFEDDLNRESVTTQMTHLSEETCLMTKPSDIFDHNELRNFALQIARGMEHMEKIPITHRDLAARNVLISEQNVLKISDFGLSRTGPYVKRKEGEDPVHWMSIEALLQNYTDNKSDVWSFGVVLWEIGTLGAKPYQDIPLNAFIAELLRGTRLEKPEICTEELYSMMLRCWSHSPADRPTFQELVKELEVTKKVYVDVRDLRRDYVFPSFSACAVKRT